MATLPDQKQISLYLPATLHQNATAQATHEGRSLAWVIRALLEKYLKDRLTLP